MGCTKAVYSNKEKKRTVTYHQDDGHKIAHEGGSRSWRNNNPGNLKGMVSRRVGVDTGGFDIYQDVQTGEEAWRRMFEPGGKYYGYISIRQVLTGLKDESGKIIRGTAYAPSNDGNYPNQYAEDVKKWTGLDVDNRKISDLTSEEKMLLMEAVKRKEGWDVGKVIEYGNDNKLITNQFISGSKDIQDFEEDNNERWGFTISP